MKPILSVNRRILSCVFASFFALICAAVSSSYSFPFMKGKPIVAAGIGLLERIVPPSNAHRLDQISSFTVSVDGADDFSRIYVNNYVVSSWERPQDLFYLVPPDAEAHVNQIMRLQRNRGLMLGEHDAKRFLRKGKNYIIIELENSILSTCVGFYSIKINGMHTQGSPVNLPERFDVEKGPFHQTLRARMNESGLSILPNALCARRIFELELL